MKLTIRRVWRSRIRLPRAGWRGWRTSALSLYWRRRARLRQAPPPRVPGAAAPRIGVAPSTVSVQCHHHAARIAWTTQVSRSMQWIERASHRASLHTRHYRDVRIVTNATFLRQAQRLMVVRWLNAGVRTAVHPTPAARASQVTSRARIRTQRLMRSTAPQFGRRRAAPRDAAPLAPPPRLPAPVTPARGRGVRVSESGRALRPGAMTVWAGLPRAGVVHAAATLMPSPPVALEWRSPAVQELRSRAATSVAPASRPASQPTAVAAAVSDSPAVVRPTIPRAAIVTPLDAPTIERLADTVLQRLDRRLRIERERRGL